MRTIRLHQWTKNLLVFVPLFVGHVFLDAQSIARSIVAFLLLSILASGTYLANDLSDLAGDRRHPGRTRRAFASGRLRLRAGFIAAPLMTLGALLAAFALDATFGTAMLFYLGLTGLYSAGLKRIALVDVFVIGTLFTTRILIGAAVLDLTQSVWLLSFSMFLFFSLALAKRHVELVGAAARGETLLEGRGYLVSDPPLTLAFGIGAGLTSVLIMLLFMTAEAAPSGFYRNPAWLFVTPAALTLWVMRIWLQSHRGTLHDDPVVFALKDRVSLGLALVIAIALALAL